jgi:hypothetical protein
MWGALMVLSFFAGLSCLIMILYCLFKKRKKRPFFIGFLISFALLLVFSFAYTENLTPEERASIQEKSEQQKAIKAEKDSAEKAQKDAEAEQKAAEKAQKDAENADAKVVSEIEKICKDQLGSKFIEVEIRENAGQPGTKMVVPHFKGNEGWDNDGTRKAMILQTRDLFNKLFNSGLPISKAVAMIQGNLIDKYGNENNSNVMKCTLTDTTSAKINWKNINQVDFKSVLDNVWIHPALRKND